jgi:hypothetical protein
VLTCYGLMNSTVSKLLCSILKCVSILFKVLKLLATCIGFRSMLFECYSLYTPSEDVTEQGIFEINMPQDLLKSTWCVGLGRVMTCKSLLQLLHMYVCLLKA